MADRPRKIKFGSSFENFIVMLHPDSIELRSPTVIGVGTTAKDKIFYDEIVAVYRYRQPNWTSLTVAALILVIGGLITIIPFASGSPLWGSIFLMALLACIAFTLYRGLVLKKMMVKVVSSLASIEFPCPNETVFGEVMSHLKIVNIAPSLTIEPA
jgi:hypothetical protein